MRKSLLFASLLIGLFILSVSPASALADPNWNISLTSTNPFGGTSFARDSGDNSYSMTVTNADLHVGETLTCDPGVWAGEPTFSYRWLRLGNPISSASGSSYRVTAEDQGKPLECELRATSGESTVVAASKAVVPAPIAPLAAPVLSPQAELFLHNIEEPQPGASCPQLRSNELSGAPTLQYQWLRNGTPLAGATENAYIFTSQDEGDVIQCAIFATNPGGTIMAVTNGVTVPPEPSTGAPYPEEEGVPTIAGGSPTSSPVSVTDQLPSGVVLAGFNTGEGEDCGYSAEVTTVCEIEADPGVWECKVATVTCETSDTVSAGETLPPITLHVHVLPDATALSTNSATVYGGGAAPLSSTATGSTTILPAVPFGIERFTTSLIGALGTPFTQAGGHPSEASTEIRFNSTTGDDHAGVLDTAGGDPKDVEVELPPGFIGNPQARAQCPLSDLRHPESECPSGSAVGFVDIAGDGHVGVGPEYGTHGFQQVVYNLVPPPGHAAAFGFTLSAGDIPFVLYGTVRSDGNYGLTVGDSATAIPTVLALKLTFCDGGVEGTRPDFQCGAPAPASAPFLTAPTACTGSAPTTTLRADTYEAPANYVWSTVYNGTSLTEGAPSETESFVSGCGLLQFKPEFEFKPSSGPEGGSSQADEPTGMSFRLKVPQTNEAGMNATPELKSATVTLPEGMTVDPSAADGLQACSNAQFGLGSTTEPAEPASCPQASQVGTVNITSPLLEKPLEGEMFVGEPECSPCSSVDAQAGHIFRLFLQARSPERGVVVKLAGEVTADPATGRLQAIFTEQPQLPFSELLLTFNGGARAPLANPQSCGTFTTTTDLTPWSAPGIGGLSGTEPIAGTPDATLSSSFNVDWDGHGGACPATLPFAPSFLAQTASSTAGQYSPLSVSFGRPVPAHESEERDEQHFAGITVDTPPGLLGKIAGVTQCPEAQASAGTCSSAAAIGTTTVAAGTGSHPFYLGGTVYLTGPYKGAPFGLSIVVPAKAGPFTLAGTNGQGDVVVRAAIGVNPSTAALTITSDPLPQIVDGVPLRLHSVRVDVNRPEFTLNPTSCAQEQVTASITGESVSSGEAGKTVSGSSQFAASNCAALPFNPSLSAQTQAKTSKADGASLRVVVAQKPGEANIARVDVQLPKQLPARLTTLQKACLAATFQSNPAACPAASIVGMAVAHTPLLSSALTGPAILVSHGGAAFPDLEVVLQGEGVTLILDGGTDIKKGVTYSRFDTVPDAPISSFELNLPEGSDSVLATDLPASANSSFCGQNLVMPTMITGQNGKQIIQTTKITTGACTKVKTKILTRAQKLAKALKACRAKYKAKSKKSMRVGCERQARKKYGPLHRAKKKAKKSSSRNGKAGR